MAEDTREIAKVIQINEGKVREHPSEMVRGSVEKTLKRDAADGSRAAVLGDALRVNGGTEKHPRPARAQAERKRS